MRMLVWLLALATPVAAAAQSVSYAPAKGGKAVNPDTHLADRPGTGERRPHVSQRRSVATGDSER